MTRHAPAAATRLRREAEARLERRGPASAGVASPTEALRLLHELQVHQVELEMQNEQLRAGREETERALARYTELYDFGPVAYLTLGPDGSIRQANLQAASLLGVKIPRLMNSSFPARLPPPDRPAFATFLEKVFAGQCVPAHQTTLQTGAGTVRDLLVTALLSENGQDCLAALIDLTERVRAETLVKELSESLRKLSGEILRAQESERMRIALELRDDIGQELVSVGLQLRVALARAGSSMEPPLAECEVIIGKVLEHIRELSLGLRPASLDDLGLEPTLRWWTARQMAHSGRPVRLVSNLEGRRLGFDLETVAYRLIQEAVNNALRHARAGRIDVEVCLQGAELRLRVEDDGIGFDPDLVAGTVADSARLGILGMKERVRLAGGSFQLISRPGSGVVIQARLPLAPGPAKPRT